MPQVGAAAAAAADNEELHVAKCNRSGPRHRLVQMIREYDQVFVRIVAAWIVLQITPFLGNGQVAHVAAFRSVEDIDGDRLFDRMIVGRFGDFERNAVETGFPRLGIVESSAERAAVLGDRYRYLSAALGCAERIRDRRRRTCGPLQRRNRRRFCPEIGGLGYLPGKALGGRSVVVPAVARIGSHRNRISAGGGLGRRAAQRILVVGDKSAGMCRTVINVIFDKSLGIFVLDDGVVDSPCNFQRIGRSVLPCIAGSGRNRCRIRAGFGSFVITGKNVSGALPYATLLGAIIREHRRMHRLVDLGNVTKLDELLSDKSRLDLVTGRSQMDTVFGDERPVEIVPVAFYLDILLSKNALDVLNGRKAQVEVVFAKIGCVHLLGRSSLGQGNIAILARTLRIEKRRNDEISATLSLDLHRHWTDVVLICINIRIIDSRAAQPDPVVAAHADDTDGIFVLVNRGILGNEFRALGNRNTLGKRIKRSHLEAGGLFALDSHAITAQGADNGIARRAGYVIFGKRKHRRHKTTELFAVRRSAIMLVAPCRIVKDKIVKIAVECHASRLRQSKSLADRNGLHSNPRRNVAGMRFALGLVDDVVIPREHSRKPVGIALWHIRNTRKTPIKIIAAIVHRYFIGLGASRDGIAVSDDEIVLDVRYWRFGLRLSILAVAENHNSRATIAACRPTVANGSAATATAALIGKRGCTRSICRAITRARSAFAGLALAFHQRSATAAARTINNGNASNLAHKTCASIASFIYRTVQRNINTGRDGATSAGSRATRTCMPQTAAIAVHRIRKKIRRIRTDLTGVNTAIIRLRRHNLAAITSIRSTRSTNITVTCITAATFSRHILNAVNLKKGVRAISACALSFSGLTIRSRLATSCAACANLKRNNIASTKTVN